MRLCAWFFLLTVPGAPTLQAAHPPGGDVIVAERIDQLVLYNKYQQHLAPGEQKALSPFTPIRVLKENDVLGDGFTPCIDVEIGGTPFYIVGGLESVRRAGFFQIYRNVLQLEDTVKVLRGRSVSYSGAARLRWEPVPEGERFLRCFRDGSRTYVRRIDPPATYGWALLPPAREGKDWKPMLQSSPVLTALPSDILARIRSRLGSTNDLLRNLFSYFNSQTSGRKPTPHWELEGSDRDASCVLLDGHGESFQQSTKYLVRDLDDILLGTGFCASASPGRIEIRRTGQAGARE
jgi:hypothetical protein